MKKILSTGQENSIEGKHGQKRHKEQPEQNGKILPLYFLTTFSSEAILPSRMKITR